MLFQINVIKMQENRCTTLVIRIVNIMTVMLFALDIHSQAPCPQYLNKYDVIDMADYVVTYKASFIRDTQKKVPEQDIIILEIGKNFSKSYSKILFAADSTATAWRKKGSAVLRMPKGNIPLEDVYKNFTTKNSKIIFRSMLQGPIYQYEESSNLMNWTLQPEKKEILSYSCQRATTSFRGREYEAWFTNDIPLPNGPWKFGGLPGLILFLKDMQSNYVFECIGLEKPKVERPIKLWSWKYENITRENLIRVKKRIHLDPYNYCISIGQVMGGDIEAKKKQIYPYNPIELE